jgi:tRNA(Ile)-lysidine synthase
VPTSVHPDLIETLLATVPGVSRVVIGFSGGLDSTVLLHLVREWQRQQPGIPVIALHVNHQLQSAADDWQQHCAHVCRDWQIPFSAETVAVDQSQASLEQSARAARYGAFRRHVGADDLLLLAHHRDDQVETLFQRLLRGSGPLGLGGMGVLSRNEGLLIGRPLLEQDRVLLEDYARQHRLRWIDDPSNQDQVFERNFLRQEALPRLRSRWPQLNQTVSRSARLSREAAELLDDLAELDGAGQCQPGEPLPVQLLAGLPQRRARNLLRYWIRLQGASLPSEAQLQRVLDDLVPAADDAQPELHWGAHCLRRFRHALYCLPLLPAPDVVELTVRQDQLAAEGLPWAGGRIVHMPLHGVAFSRTRLQQGPLVLRLRQGGERLKPMGRATNSLKHWLQACEVPPWWRERWPLLYCGDELAGLPGLLVSQGFEPVEPADALWLDWQPPALKSSAGS